MDNRVLELADRQASQKAIIIVDSRERQSSVITHLRDHPAIIEEQQLQIGDYICSDRVCAERKTVADFLASLTDQRLFTQLESLAAAYEKPILLLEGNSESLFYSSIHPNAIRGALASISLDYRVPIIWTRNPKETAAQLYWIAKREQFPQSRQPQIRSQKPEAVALPLYLTAGLPGVSSVLAARLLKKFRSVRQLANATPEELQKVEGIGEEKAKKIMEAFNQTYRKARTTKEKEKNEEKNGEKNEGKNEEKSPAAKEDKQ